MFLRTRFDVPSLNHGVFVRFHCWLGQFPLNQVVLSTTTSLGLQRAGAVLKFGPGGTVRV